MITGAQVALLEAQVLMLEARHIWVVAEEEGLQHQLPQVQQAVHHIFHLQAEVVVVALTQPTPEHLN